MKFCLICLCCFALAVFLKLEVAAMVFVALAVFGSFAIIISDVVKFLKSFKK